MSWRWITKLALMLLHSESLATHGGGEGLRDEGLVDSALACPHNLLTCADADASPDVAVLAASYTVGLAKNHPFVDANKGAAFLATGLFLHLNGYRPEAGRSYHHHPGRRHKRHQRRWLCRLAAFAYP